MIGSNKVRKNKNKTTTKFETEENRILVAGVHRVLGMEFLQLEFTKIQVLYLPTARTVYHIPYPNYALWIAQINNIDVLFIKQFRMLMRDGRKKTCIHLYINTPTNAHIQNEIHVHAAFTHTHIVWTNQLMYYRHGP